MGNEYVDITADGTVARVVHKSDDGRKLYFAQKNGGAGNITSEATLDPNVGDVLMLWPDFNRYEVVPQEVWPEAVPPRKEDTIAIVRLKLEDQTVVDEGGKLHFVPTCSEPSYEEGNTVAISPDGRIDRVLTKKPLRLIDIATTSDIDINRFKVDPTTIKETFDDFGGMENIVTRAKKLIELPLKKGELLEKIGARPIKGVLFSGPPGTGKTMLARIIAGHAKAVFYTVSGPEILTKWYGESEAVLRGIFADAEKQDQAIIFFDEIDTIAMSRGDNTHEVSKKLVGQLLTLMDGFSPSKKVVVVAATNRPTTLDPALRRPGRFDWEVEFILPDLRARQAILERATRSLAIAPNLPHDEVAEKTDGWTPAELAVIWSEAALLAVEDERERIHEEDYLEGHRRVAQQRNQREVANV